MLDVFLFSDLFFEDESLNLLDDFFPYSYLLPEELFSGEDFLGGSDETV